MNNDNRFFSATTDLNITKIRLKIVEDGASSQVVLDS